MLAFPYSPEKLSIAKTVSVVPKESDEPVNREMRITRALSSKKPSMSCRKLIDDFATLLPHDRQIKVPVAGNFHRLIQQEYRYRHLLFGASLKSVLSRIPIHDEDLPDDYTNIAKLITEFSANPVTLPDEVYNSQAAKSREYTIIIYRSEIGSVTTEMINRICQMDSGNLIADYLLHSNEMILVRKPPKGQFISIIENHESKIHVIEKKRSKVVISEAIHIVESDNIDLKTFIWRITILKSETLFPSQGKCSLEEVVDDKKSKTILSESFRFYLLFMFELLKIFACFSLGLSYAFACLMSRFFIFALRIIIFYFLKDLLITISSFIEMIDNFIGQLPIDKRELEGNSVLDSENFGSQMGNSPQLQLALVYSVGYSYRLVG